MKFFLDSADLDEIKDLNETGFVDGVTTNPTLLARSGHGKVLSLLEDIAKTVSGPVSAEVTATDYVTMLKEAEKLAAIAPNIIIKVPLSFEGLKVCQTLATQGVQFNVTLCFSVIQAVMAAHAGATFVSPFMGRLDDNGEDGAKRIKEIVETFRNYPDIHTNVLASSIRTVKHVEQAARAGAEYATIPGKIFHEMIKHPLTDKGLAAFLEDWGKTGQSIL